MINSIATKSYTCIKHRIWNTFVKHQNRLCILAVLVGLMDELEFYVPSTVFQSFRDDGRVNMKDSVQ